MTKTPTELLRIYGDRMAEAAKEYLFFEGTASVRQHADLELAIGAWESLRKQQDEDALAPLLDEVGP